jgi:hypothetical protein
MIYQTTRVSHESFTGVGGDINLRLCASRRNTVNSTVVCVFVAAGTCLQSRCPENNRCLRDHRLATGQYVTAQTFEDEQSGYSETSSQFPARRHGSVVHYPDMVDFFVIT